MLARASLHAWITIILLAQSFGQERRIPDTDIGTDYGLGKRTSRDRLVYLDEVCSAIGPSTRRSHYLGLSDEKASMTVYSHRNNTIPRTMRKCKLQVQTESHARLTITLERLDTLESPFVCYMYIKLHTTLEMPDVLCGRDVYGRSIATSFSHLAIEWVINNGGEKPGMIHMVITSFKDIDLSGKCEAKMYHCHNARCIWEGFVCDGTNNCGDGSDERLCIGGRQDHTLLMSIIVLALLLALGVGIAIQMYISSRMTQTQFIVGPDAQPRAGVHEAPKD
ncbi:uncharacterized protein LOC135400853 [Ornithodoros turicata]|uniref:uncharacterized protein LOC135400853 n=1 Tax=Ornithodoros turicata TaxID=34597 RepID=UPI0031399C0D